MKIYVNPRDHIIVEIGGKRVEIICPSPLSSGTQYITIGGGGGGTAGDTMSATGGAGGGYARRDTDK